ncbi:MAG TPA: hemerythrin domain-containing protein, partial [Stenomitos sp.]
MAPTSGLTRRSFLQVATTLAGGLALTACTSMPAIAQARTRAETVKADVEEVLPVEDLMREHGVLRRLLLVYGEAIRRMEASEPLDPAIVSRSATLIRRFIEDYHEKNEEDYLFPRFQEAGKLVDLVRVLKEQHEAGRRVTARVLDLATAAGMSRSEDRTALVTELRRFIRMYEPHSAREDTVLFPAFR